MREAVVERRLKRGAEALGGMCLKFVSPGTRGIPDRICIIDGQVTFIELKAPGKTPTKVQTAVHKRMRKCGAVVKTFSSVEDVDKFLRENEL